jgi:hypothetical protein
MENKPKSLSDYNEGDTYRGELISKLYAARQDYLIFEGDNSGEVTVATDKQDLRKRVSEIGPKISLITEYLYSKKEKKKFVDQIGLAYSEAIEDNLANAGKICDKLITRIELYKNNIGRFYYLLSCLSIVLISITISFFLKKYNFIPEILPHFYIMTYASIGGFLSVAKDIKKIQIDSSDFGWFQFIYGSVRILISMFSGLVIYILIRSELIFPELNRQENIFVICVLAVVAGFSETFLPNLLQKIEKEDFKK